VSDDSNPTPGDGTGSPEPSAPATPESEGDNAGASGPAPEGASAGVAPSAAPPPSRGDEPHAEAAARSPQAKPPRRKPRDPSVARAFRAGLPVEGKVEKVIKGGYEVHVGRCRGFCPHSQIDVHRVDTPEEHIGKTYRFKILQMRHGGDDVVVSRRALMEADRAEEAKAVRATLIEGSVMQGRVARLADFGAFVDLGAGVTGLVHVSEVGPARVASVGDSLRVGDWVSVRVLKLDAESGRISLSIRQAQDDPWKGAEARFTAGHVYPGTVGRMTNFGAFVEMAPGIEALAPAREFPPSAEGWTEGLAPGSVVDWLVVSIDAERRRMSLAPAPTDGAAPGPVPLETGAKLRGKVQRVEKFGVFVWLGPGQVGLVPNAWTGTARGADLLRHFPVGKEVEVTLVDVEDGGRRIRLTMDEAATAASDGQTSRRVQRPPGGPEHRAPGGPANRQERQEGPAAQPPATFGTNLGDALKTALERNRGRES
jgi:small subunit ribosomal protein S1